MDKSRVEALLNEALEQNKELFLVDFTISPSNHISVIVDGDKGVNVSECMRISRNIEHNLDRENEDFSLEVSSFDVAKPLILPRQYSKNIGRELKVKLKDDSKIAGTLVDFADNQIKLSWEERVPKTIGKGKMTVVKEQLINIDDIKEAKVVIIF